MASPQTYSRTQITLHWIIALLVIFQIVLHGGMEEAYHQRSEGMEVAVTNPHAIVGMLVLVLAIWRLILRLTRGAPPPPADEPMLLQWLASATHWAFYALLFIMPLSGIAMWGLNIPQAGPVHAAGQLLLIVLILLHIVGALAHQFWFKTNVLKRMVGRA